MVLPFAGTPASGAHRHSIFVQFSVVGVAQPPAILYEDAVFAIFFFLHFFWLVGIGCGLYSYSYVSVSEIPVFRKCTSTYADATAMLWNTMLCRKIVYILYNYSTVLFRFHFHPSLWLFRFWLHIHNRHIHTMGHTRRWRMLIIYRLIASYR